MKPLPQKFVMGSDWLADSVYCDSLNRQCRFRNVTPLTSAACAPVLYCKQRCLNIVYQFEPDWDAEDINEEDRAELVQAHGS